MLERFLADRFSLRIVEFVLAVVLESVLKVVILVDPLSGRDPLSVEDVGSLYILHGYSPFSVTGSLDRLGDLVSGSCVAGANRLRSGPDCTSKESLQADCRLYLGFFLGRAPDDVGRRLPQ